jgi:hypothetical protein
MRENVRGLPESTDAPAIDAASDPIPEMGPRLRRKVLFGDFVGPGSKAFRPVGPAFQATSATSAMSAREWMSSRAGFGRPK